MTSNTLFKSVPGGYPQLATFISKDKSFSIFRKFNALNLRTLDMQLQSTSEGKDSLRSWLGFRNDEGRFRLIKDMREVLKEYNTALIQYEQILNIESPSRRNIGGVKTWMQHNQPIRDESKTYLENREVQGDLREILAKRRPNRDVEEGVQELVSLNKPSDSLLARYLRRSWLGIFLMRDLIYCDDKKEAAIFFFPGSKIDQLVTGCAVLVAVVITVVSIVALHIEQRDPVRYGLIGLFAIVLAAVMALCGAKRAEVMVGTIGFAAVMVVFVQGYPS